MSSIQLDLGFPWIATFSQAVTGEQHTKRCKTCGIEKPDSAFIKADGQHRATRNRCKACATEQSEIRRQLRLQNPPPPPGECPICLYQTDKWVLDHCHTGGTFRGYVCTSCNSGIGLLHDDPLVIRRAFNYLLTYTDATITDRGWRSNCLSSGLGS